MPIYEFRCKSCNRIANFFVKRITESWKPTCPNCGGDELERLFSRFAVHKSISAIHEESDEPSMYHTNPDYYKDPRNIGRWTEKRLKELGMDMDSEEYKNTFAEVKESIAAAREGELPQSIKDQF